MPQLAPPIKVVGGDAQCGLERRAADRDDVDKRDLDAGLAEALHAFDALGGAAVDDQLIDHAFGDCLDRGAAVATRSVPPDSPCVAWMEVCTVPDTTPTTRNPGCLDFDSVRLEVCVIAGVAQRVVIAAASKAERRRGSICRECSRSPESRHRR